MEFLNYSFAIFSTILFCLAYFIFKYRYTFFKRKNSELDKRAFELLEKNNFQGFVDLYVGNIGNPKLSPTARNFNRTTILMHAISKDSGYPFVEYLLKIGSDINAVDNVNRTATILACHWNRNEMLKILLEYKPDLNIVSTERAYSITALTSALVKDNYEMAKILLQNGACPVLALQSSFLKFLESDQIEKITKFLQPYIRWNQGQRNIALCRKYYKERKYLDYKPIQLVGKLSYLKYRMILKEYL